jgi:DNA-binding transcriptional MerR regulator
MGTTAKVSAGFGRGSNRLFKLPEVASELGVHENSIRNWLAKGLITSRLTPAGTPVWTGQDILDLLEHMKTAGHRGNDGEDNQ